MLNWISTHQTLIIIILFLLFALLEAWRPVYQARVSVIGRWGTNVGLYLLNNVVFSGLNLFFGVWLAMWSGQHQIGLFNLIDAPLWLIMIIGILAMDFKTYLVHRAFHCVPFLWRLHKVHHSDVEIDLTTSFRTHPGEAFFIFFPHTLLILALGLPYESILIFWLVSKIWGLFTHGNISLEDKFERRIQSVLITPVTHRIHHSISLAESNSNFAEVFSCWDKLFGTYRSVSESDQQYGLAEHRNAARLYLPQLLLMPFKYQG